jgi:adenine-specific DNA-methyltransferase
VAEDAGVTWQSARVLDPAAGAGAFLLQVAAKMISSMKGSDPAFILQQLGVRLRGFELDPFGAWLGQAMVQLVIDDLVRAARRAAPKVIDTRDSLDPELAHDETYDLVIGNPPYGRTPLPPDRRKAFSRSVYGHANLYGLFTDAALRWAKPGGVVAYVTPTSMLSGLYFKSLRRLIASEAPPQSIHFVNQREGVFADVLQETMLAAYKRGGIAKGGKVGVLEVDSAGNVSHQKTGLIAIPRRPEAPWLLPRSRAEAMLTRRLHSMPHRLSDYGYGVSTGPLVWNRFKNQFSDEPADNCYPVIWAESVTSDGRFVWRSERRDHAPWFEANRPKDDWLIVTKPCVLLQRTTAKEQARRLIAAELPRSFVARHGGVMVENHLNMVRAIVPKPRIPPSVIARLLNSAAVDAAFRCLNGSVAVSAFELEELPLPAPSVVARLSKLALSRVSAAKIEATIAAAYRVKNVSGAN